MFAKAKLSSPHLFLMTPWLQLLLHVTQCHVLFVHDTVISESCFSVSLLVLHNHRESIHNGKREPQAIGASW